MGKNLITDINRMKGMMGLSEITFRELESSTGDDGEVRKIPKSRSILALKWLNKKYGDLTEVVTDKITFYVNKDRLPLFFYYQNEKNGDVKINYYDLWSSLSNTFGLDGHQTEEILNIWLKEAYNLGGFRTSPFSWKEAKYWIEPII